jgi:hypothetical protein
MRRGLDQGEVDLLMMPSAFNCLNFALAANSFSLSRRPNLEAMGGPVVTIWCSTPCTVTWGRGPIGINYCRKTCQDPLIKPLGHCHSKLLKKLVTATLVW